MTVMDYRTRDGLADYGFAIDFQPDIGWRVYIVFQPVQQSTDSGPPVPYQSVDPTGRRYVDWSEKLDNLGDAKKVAALWAELVQNYQRDQGQKARDVELIERYRSTREGRKATPDRTGDGVVDAGAASPGYQDCGSVIPHPRASAESLSDRHESV